MMERQDAAARARTRRPKGDRSGVIRSVIGRSPSGGSSLGCRASHGAGRGVVPAVAVAVGVVALDGGTLPGSFLELRQPRMVGVRVDLSQDVAQQRPRDQIYPYADQDRKSTRLN